MRRPRGERSRYLSWGRIHTSAAARRGDARADDVVTLSLNAGGLPLIPFASGAIGQHIQ
jgi:hypothetical protein